MNITSIRLQGLFTVDLPLYVAKPSDPYLIKAAEGLGPPGFDVSIVDGTFQGREAQNRELSFRVGLTPNYRLNQTAADLRDQLYGLLTPPNGNGAVPIHFMQGDAILASTEGWVANIEPVLFTKEPEVLVTLPCAEAYLRGPVPVEVVPPQKWTWSVDNAGTAPTGVELEVIFTAARPSWEFTHPLGTMRFEYAFQVGDILHIDTREESRSIRVTRADVTKEIIHSLTKESEWVELHGGTNQFAAGSAEFNWGYIRYTPLYQGV